MYIAYILAKSRANAGLYDNVYDVYEDDYDYVYDYESGGKKNNHPLPPNARVSVRQVQWRGEANAARRPSCLTSGWTPLQ